MLNPSIFNQIDIPRVRSAEDLLMEQFTRAKNQDAMFAMRQAREDDNALRQLLRSGDAGETLEQKLISSGLIRQGQDMRKARLDAEKTAAEIGNQKATAGKSVADTKKIEQETLGKKLEQAKTRLEFMGQVIGAAVDQPSYDQGLQAMASNGIDVSNIPKVFDPNIVKAAGQQTITALQRIQAEQAKANAQETNRSNVARETETAANNLRTDTRIQKEGAANRGIQIRGQNLTNERAQEQMSKPFEATAPDGSRVFVQQNKAGQLTQVQGFAPPTKAAPQSEAGKEQVSTVLAGLRDIYDQLNEGGGIQNSDRGTLSNLTSRLQSTGPGQTMGQFAGTKNQRLRDSIEQQRPLLLQAIKQATGMSAKQMDSNAEMKLFLAAATDPTKDIKANFDAIANLERMFGQSLPKPDAQTKPKPRLSSSIDVPLDAIEAEIRRRGLK